MQLLTLSKPLGVEREAQIKARRELHNSIYQEYRMQHCTEGGDQDAALTAEESRGLKSLRKTIKNEELVVMKTDKSWKRLII